MDNGIVDLHCHTRHSDNSMTAEEVLLLARQNGVSCLAVTDHDTTDGLEDAILIGQRIGLRIIPGIEISAFDRETNKKAHILGYHVIPGHNAIKKLCGPVLERRSAASRSAVERIREAGYSITTEEVESIASSSTAVYKQHIMHALMNRGYSDSIHGELHRKLFGADGGIAYFPIEYPDAEEAVRAVAEAGGIPVLAHPGQQENFACIPRLVEAGLLGVELLHPSHREPHIVQIKKTIELYGLIATGGSDFHGLYGSGNNIPGSIHAGFECVAQLDAAINRVNRKIN